LGGNSGATAGALGSGIGRWQASAPSAEFELAGAPYPSLKKGASTTFSDTTTALPGVFAAITASCKSPETAKRVLDYAYGDEGYMLYNFGIEGESYKMAGGYPTYTENITHNGEGLSMSAAMARYMRSCADGPFVQDKRYMEQYSNLPQQKQAWDTWVKTDGEDHIIPNIYIDESAADDIAQKRNSITTYKGEMSIAFIIGNEPLSKYGEFKAELTRRGVDAVLAEMQKAYDRYLTR
jgi:putative aldouronate transport system substrate-binding protein